MSTASIRKLGVEVSVPWIGRKMRLLIPLGQALQTETEVPQNLKNQMKTAQVLGGELKQLKTVSESMRAELWFSDEESFLKFCAQENLQIKSYMLMIQITFESSVCIDVHNEHSLMNALERKREILGKEVDQVRNFLKFIKEKNGKFQSAYTKGRSSKVCLDFSYENRENWLATIGALK